MNTNLQNCRGQAMKHPLRYSVRLVKSLIYMLTKKIELGYVFLMFILKKY